MSTIVSDTGPEVWAKGWGKYLQRRLHKAIRPGTQTAAAGLRTQMVKRDRPGHPDAQEEGRISGQDAFDRILVSPIQAGAGSSLVKVQGHALARANEIHMYVCCLAVLHACGQP